MPKRSDIKKVLVIGSGPIIIGQAAEFDYAGTQACRALKGEGIETVLINSNPATIMTDKNIADHVYIEPLNVETVMKVILKEKPDSILPTLGGQTGLNLAMELAESGFLEENNVRLLGTSIQAIKSAEDRQQFKDTMNRIKQPCIESEIENSVDTALTFAEKIGYPVIVRPAYTLGGTGGGIAYNKNELKEIAKTGLMYSRVRQILIEKCISGWKEIEYEVMRDSKGNVITVCSMENIDPVGVHTGDSIVVAPVQTLSDKEYQMLRTAALNIISELKIEGGCNVQFALHPDSFEYAVIEVNPRVSRSSALASKATGYPIANIATLISIGYGLDEIQNRVTGKTYACFEPVLDYVVLKIPKWPFDKFVKAKRTLGTQMKATGEVMAISNNFESALMKAVRSLELNIETLYQPVYTKYTDLQIQEMLKNTDDQRLFVVAEALRRDISVELIHIITTIDTFFIYKIKSIIDTEQNLNAMTPEELYKAAEVLKEAKSKGFTDGGIAKLVKCDKRIVRQVREKLGIIPVFKVVDTCAAEFDAETPYYYSVYDEENEVRKSTHKKVLVIGSGPIRIGQGIEFDYCSVHSVWALKEAGYETIIANNNPETVSTDFDTADRLYFEPLTEEDVYHIIKAENPEGVIVQFGGQTAIKLTKDLQNMGVKIFGTQPEQVDEAEDRKRFDEILERTGIPRPKGQTVFTLEEALKAADQLIYPVLVRPSYVLGGKGMEIAYDRNDLTEFMEIINRTEQEHPILIDKYMTGREIEVDAICDGNDVLIPGIMEHLERAGVHSGDSISIYPTVNLTQGLIDTVVDYSKRLALALKVKGMVNIQYVISNNNVYVIEVNPRSSRTVPYISKTTGIPMVNVATKIMMGENLNRFPYGTGLYKASKYYAVKVPVFSFEKLSDVDTGLGPEMKSTGEVLGLAENYEDALLKGLIAAGFDLETIYNDRISDKGVLMTVRDTDKQELIPIAEIFEKMGFKLYGTGKTARTLNAHGIATNVVRKLGEGEQNVLDLIDMNKICLIINTPTKGRRPAADGFKIRRKAVEMKIPCLTSLDTAKAVAECMSGNKKTKDLNIYSLNIFD